MRKKRVLPEGTLDASGARLHSSRRKSLHRLDKEKRLRKTGATHNRVIKLATELHKCL